MSHSLVDQSFTVDREVEPLMVVTPMDQQLCELVSRVLIKHYPGHDWLVEADCRKGFIDIRNISLHGQMGCRIPMDGAASSSELEAIAMRYGGEILERFHVTRGGLRQHEIEAIGTNVAGHLEFDK